MNNTLWKCVAFIFAIGAGSFTMLSSFSKEVDAVFLGRVAAFAAYANLHSRVAKILPSNSAKDVD